jgi:3',5'-cyclic AMP phosphodiesterase CpdA
MLKIIHVSDLHFGKSDDQDTDAKDLLDAVYKEFFQGTDSCYLLVSGDITDSGEPDEFTSAKKALSRFKGRVFLTPGNHDYGSFLGTDYDEDKAKYFDNPFADSLGFSHPFFKKTVFNRQLPNNSDPSPVLIIGLNSCAKEGMLDAAQGEIGERQMKELADLLTKYGKEVTKLLFLHHIPNREADWSLIMTLRDWEELMAATAGSIDVFAFGHQGDELAVKRRVKGVTAPPRPAPPRPMKVRSVGLRKSKGGKRALVLDADNSVADKPCYVIELQGNKLTATVRSFL